MGAGRTQREAPARPGDGGRHLRRIVCAQERGHRGGGSRAGQLGRHAAGELRRGGRHPAHVPLGRERVPDQRRGGAPHGRAGHPARLGAGNGHALHHLAGKPGLHPAVEAGGPPRPHRGGRRRAEAQAAQGEERAQAGRHGRSPGPREGRGRRGGAPAGAVGAQGEARPHLPGAGRRAGGSEPVPRSGRPSHAAPRVGRRARARAGAGSGVGGAARRQRPGRGRGRGAAGEDPPRERGRGRAGPPAPPRLFGRRAFRRCDAAAAREAPCRPELRGRAARDA